MNKITYIAFILLVFLNTDILSAQRFEKLDKTPHDIAYYRESRISKPIVKVLYGRPTSKKKVEVFGTEIPFNEIWRTGANEATEIKLYKDITFGGKKVKAGTYVLYTIPNEKTWKVILSSNTDVLGAYQYDPIFNVAEIEVPVSKAENLDTFSIGFKKVKVDSINMVLAWKSTRVKVPINVKEEDKNNFANNSKIKLIPKNKL